MASQDERHWPRRLHLMVPPRTERYGIGKPMPVDAYLRRFRDHLAAAEELDADGFLIYNFPAALDAWLVAFDVLAGTRRAVPIVGVLPFHEHPSVVSRRVDSLAYRFGRGAHLNVVSGASRAEREAHGHDDDRRRARRQLGRYVADLNSRAPESGWRPRVFSPASVTQAEVPVATDCTIVMAKPRQILSTELSEQGARATAMLIGLVARPSADEAWAAAHAAFPADRRSRVAVRMQMADNRSSQHERNDELARGGERYDECLWYGAGTTGIDAPKLVGSYQEVAAALRRYAGCGADELIIDLPANVAEYAHVRTVLNLLDRPAPVTPARSR